MHQLVVRAHRRRAGPHVVIEIGRRIGIGGIIGGAHVVVAVDLDQADLSQQPGLDDTVDGLHQVRRAAPLRAHLHHALMLSRGGQHGLAFDDVDTDGLLHVDIGPGLDGGDHGQGVPVIRRRDLDDVEVFLLEHLAIVVVEARLLFGALAGGDEIGGLGQHLLVHVAERDDFDRCDLHQTQDVALTVPARADQTDTARLLVGIGSSEPAAGGKSKSSGGGCEELAAVHGSCLRKIGEKSSIVGFVEVGLSGLQSSRAGM